MEENVLLSLMRRQNSPDINVAQEATNELTQNFNGQPSFEDDIIEAFDLTRDIKEIHGLYVILTRWYTTQIKLISDKRDQIQYSFAVGEKLMALLQNENYGYLDTIIEQTADVFAFIYCLAHASKIKWNGVDKILTYASNDIKYFKTSVAFLKSILAKNNMLIVDFVQYHSILAQVGFSLEDFQLQIDTVDLLMSFLCFDCIGNINELEDFYIENILKVAHDSLICANDDQLCQLWESLVVIKKPENCAKLLEIAFVWLNSYKDKEGLISHSIFGYIINNFIFIPPDKALEIINIGVESIKDLQCERNINSSFELMIDNANKAYGREFLEPILIEGCKLLLENGTVSMIGSYFFRSYLKLYPDTIEDTVFSDVVNLCMNNIAGGDLSIGCVGCLVEITSTNLFANIDCQALFDNLISLFNSDNKDYRFNSHQIISLILVGMTSEISWAFDKLSQVDIGSIPSENIPAFLFNLALATKLTRYVCDNILIRYRNFIIENINEFSNSISIARFVTIVGALDVDLFDDLLKIMIPLLINESENDPECIQTIISQLYSYGGYLHPLINPHIEQLLSQSVDLQEDQLKGNTVALELSFSCMNEETFKLPLTQKVISILIKYFQLKQIGINISYLNLFKNIFSHVKVFNSKFFIQMFQILGKRIIDSEDRELNIYLNLTKVMLEKKQINFIKERIQYTNEQNEQLFQYIQMHAVNCVKNMLECKGDSMLEFIYQNITPICDLMEFFSRYNLSILHDFIGNVLNSICADSTPTMYLPFFKLMNKCLKRGNLNDKEKEDYIDFCMKQLIEPNVKTYDLFETIIMSLYYLPYTEVLKVVNNLISSFEEMNNQLAFYSRAITSLLLAKTYFSMLENGEKADELRQFVFYMADQFPNNDDEFNNQALVLLNYYFELLDEEIKVRAYMLFMHTLSMTKQLSINQYSIKPKTIEAIHQKLQIFLENYPEKFEEIASDLLREDDPLKYNRLHQVMNILVPN